MKIQIYTADVSPLSREDIFARIYESAGRERQEKTDALRFRKDKNLSLGVEFLLMQACRDAGMAYPAPIAREEWGKPDFSCGDLHFSLSHSEQRAMCVLAEGKIGCDTEKIRNVNNAVAARYFSPEENGFWQGAPESEQARKFTEIWCAKESFIKLSGRGIGLLPKQFSVVHEGKPEMPGYILRCWSEDDGYGYGFCAEGQENRDAAEEKEIYREDGICICRKTVFL